VNHKATINAAKERFDKELHNKNYHQIHSDDDQLIKLVDMMDIIENKAYLDLGTGNGYVAFYIAKKHPKIKVCGLDIANTSIITNNEIANQEQISNLNLISYDGTNYPFETGQFSGVISRYAFHHFPDNQKSISEISRVLEPRGYFILSDPFAYSEDSSNFIDEFQALKNDGHVHYYKRDEIEQLFEKNGFVIEKEFISFVRYPRDFNNSYIELFQKTDNEVLGKYGIEIDGGVIHITASVMNILFRKRN
jgi:ubiquinone/menaquinone biosynthesis C-methylase UbiE